MALKVTFTNPNFPKSEEFETPMGVLVNGVPKTLTEDDERNTLAKTGLSIKDLLAGNGTYKVEGSSELSAKEVEAQKGVNVSDVRPIMIHEEPKAVEGGDN